MSTESSRASSSVAALERIYRKHTRATRVLHWTNVITLGTLLWTALLLLSGTPELPYSHWLPPAFYAALHLDNRNDEGRVWHVLFSFLMIAVGVAYTAYLAISGRWKTFLPNATSGSDAYRVVLNDLGIRRHTPTQEKYNGAQRIAYTGVAILGLGEVITGLAIYVKDWTGLANVLGGQNAIRAEHFALMLGIIAFIVVHLVQVGRAGWNNARSMVIGDEIIGAHGLRATVEQAVPELALLSAPMPHARVDAILRTKSRGSALTALIVAGATVAFIGFAHQQSASRAGVPTWLDWARDTQDPASDPGHAKAKAGSEPDRATKPTDGDAKGDAK